MGWDAYIDNLCATGQANNGEIIGLDGTAWTAKLGVTAAEGKAIADGFNDGGTALRSTGIMMAGKKWMFLRADEEMMCGKSGAEGVNIFKAGTCIFIGTHDKDMSPAMNSKETGKMADYLKEQGY